MANFNPEIITLPAQPVLFLEYKGPYWEIGTTDVFLKIGSVIQKHPDQIKGTMFILYYDNPKETPLENCRADICLPVSDSFTPPSGYSKKILPESICLKLLFQGSYYSAEKYKAYQVLRDWFNSSKEYDYDKTRPVMEIYLNNPIEVPEEDLLTDIYFPAKKR